MRTLRSRSLVPSLAVVLILGACDDPARPPDPGAIRVVVTPSGEDIGVLGLRVTLGNLQSRLLDSGRFDVTFFGLEPGVQTVRLDGLATNCQVTGDNPRSVTVVSNQTTTTQFNMTCAARVGSVRVTTSTTGTGIDPDGYTARVLGGPSRAVPANGTATIANVREGHKLVTLDGIAPNCAITGPDTTSVTVQFGGTSDVAFALQCVEFGSMVVTVATTGTDLDPNGYTVDVQSVNAGFARAVSVAPNASVTFPALRPAADYRVVLQEMAPNCAVRGGNARTVAVTAGGSTNVTFEVACESARLLAIERQGDIYVIGSNGAEVSRLTTDPGADGAPAWSSIGRIAFTSDRHSGDRELYVMKEDGTGQTRLTTSAGMDDAPSWSPDGQRIVFRSFRDVNDEIYIVNADGGGLTRVTNNDASDREPAWSSTGKIAFISDREHGAGEIYVMNPDGSNVVRLTNNDVAESGPAWSPDGSMIAFTRQVECYYGCRDDIFVMNADGSNQRRLETGWATYQHHSDPAWSPNGQAIAFTRQYCDYYQCSAQSLWVVAVQGTDLAQIADNAANPAWRP